MSKHNLCNFVAIRDGQIVTAIINYSILYKNPHVAHHDNFTNNSQLVGNPVRIFYDESLSSPIILTDENILYSCDINIISKIHTYDDILNKYCQATILSINIDSIIFKTDEKYFIYYSGTLYHLDNCASVPQNNSFKSHIVIYIDIDGQLIVYDLVDGVTIPIDSNVSNIVGNLFFKNGLHQIIGCIIYQKPHKLFYCRFVYDQKMLQINSIRITNNSHIDVMHDTLYFGIYFNVCVCYCIGSDGQLYSINIALNNTYTLEITVVNIGNADYIFVDAIRKGNLLFLQTSKSEIILFDAYCKFVKKILEACQFKITKTRTKNSANFTA
jgi:hypothetical protein